MQTQVHFYLSGLEEELDRIKRMNREFLTEDDVQNLSAIALLSRQPR